MSGRCLLIGWTALALTIDASSGVRLEGAKSRSVEPVITDAQWQQIDDSVEQGLTWLARQQQRDGSFPTLPKGQPGVTGLCVLAFMSHGHMPGQGPYGDHLNKAIHFIAARQKRNGLLALIAPNGSKLSRNVPHNTGNTVPYNHAIAGLALSESYAMEGAESAKKIYPVIRKALDATLEMQNWPKKKAVDDGGWRYLNIYNDYDSDLSATGWQLMFLRSAKNAGFDVSSEPIERAVQYVRRCFRPGSGTFFYRPEKDTPPTRGMAGAGILALAHSGLHHTTEAQASGNWTLNHRFDEYNGGGRYHYGLLTCSLAMYQLGGDHWKQFFPSTAATVVRGQRPNGSWPSEDDKRDAKFGNAYTTAVCLIALSAPNQLLPIFQR